MNFSDRVPGDLSHNRLARAVEARRGDYIDLTESNPTRCGIDYPPDLLGALGQDAFPYRPDPFGDPDAREALAAYLSARGFPARPDNLLLTASTSEAYAFLFKLFGDPGDSFLVPRPGYPLLDHLAALEGLEALPYPLLPEPGWPLDFEGLAAAARPHTRGLVTIQPHNPTGTFLSAADRSRLAGLCRERQWVLIQDEVFRDYGEPTPWEAPEGFLRFSLGGLSKSLALPQLKLSWMVWEGPREMREACRERLELIADTYLSVNTPVQRLLPSLLAQAPVLQARIQARIAENRAALGLTLARSSGLKGWPTPAGWYALLEAGPGAADDEELALGLLERGGVLVHPGGFYDFPPERRFLVLSLLPPTEVFQEGLTRLTAALAGL